MKKLLSFILVLSLVISCVSMMNFTVFAEAQDITQYLTYEIIDGEAIITNCDDSANGKFYIPATINGYPVTAIKKINQFGDGLFIRCENIISITIPDTVTYIEDHTFYRCKNLSAVKLSKNIKAIREYTFAECPLLKSIEIPEGVESIDRFAFYESGIESISLPDSLKTMANSLFGYCENLKSVTIPKNVTDIGIFVFRNCPSLTTLTVDPNNNTFYSKGNCIIEKETKKLIAGCNNSIIPDNVEIIGDSAFCGCENLKQIVIPEGVTTLEIDAFTNCSSLETVSLPKSLISIGEHAFFSCKNLSTINLENNIETIGSHAFSDCDNLTDINIPDSVTVIESGAFYSCNGLQSILVDSNNAIFHSKNNCLIETATKKLILACENSIIPDYVEIIGTDSFVGVDTLTELVIPASVTTIEYSSFIACKNLSKVYYKGTETQWNSINISPYSNDPLLNAEVVYNYVPTITYGDVNSDTFVNKKDDLALRKFLADPAYEINLEAANVFYDDAVNKKDLLRLKQHLADPDVFLGPEVTPTPTPTSTPTPTPTSAPTPTPDDDGDLKLPFDPFR